MMDERKLVFRCSQGDVVEEIWFEDWSWILVTRTPLGVNESEISASIALKYSETSFDFLKCDELIFLECFPELPLVFTHPSKISFHPKGWKLIDFSESNTDFDFFENFYHWSHQTFIFSKDSKYIEIQLSVHWEAAHLAEPTIAMLEPCEVASRLQLKGKELPEELQKFAQFQELKLDNLNDLLSPREMSEDEENEPVFSSKSLRAGDGEVVASSIATDDMPEVTLVDPDNNGDNTRDKNEKGANKYRRRLIELRALRSQYEKNECDQEIIKRAKNWLGRDWATESKRTKKAWYQWFDEKEQQELIELKSFFLKKWKKANSQKPSQNLAQK